MPLSAPVTVYDVKQESRNGKILFNFDYNNQTSINVSVHINVASIMYNFMCVFFCFFSFSHP